MSKQKGELRVVIQHEERYALYWYAKLTGEDLYTGTGAKFFQGARVSHHASGKGHAHVGRGQRLTAEPSQAPGRLIGKDKITSWSYDLAMLDWDYHQPKRDAVHRRTLVLDQPQSSVSVDLWILQPHQPHLVREVLDEYRQMRLLGQLHIAVTKPELFAVVWTMTDQGLASFAKAVARSVEEQNP